MLKKQFNTLMSTAVLCLLFVTSSTSYAAGFHYQLNLTARTAVTPDGELSGIEMSWLYDPSLSATLMDGEDLSEAKRKESLEKRAKDILDGLAGMKYFTTITLDGKELSTMAVVNYNLQWTAGTQLQLNLTLPLTEAYALKGHELKVAISDPTATGLATFVSADKFLLNESLKPVCKTPALEQKEQDAGDGHLLVTETITVDCR